MRHAVRLNVLVLAVFMIGAFGCGKISTSGEDSIYKAAENGDAAAVSAAIRTGELKVDTPDDSGKTLLHHAVIGNQPDLVARLVDDHGADIAATDADGRTPLDYADEAGNNEIIRVLLDAAGES